MTLPAGFYNRDAREVAVDLIGCVLTHNTTEGVISGMIVETEAYRQDDPACHAYRGLTKRNKVLFGVPGRAYVYLSYGIHALLNAVCEPEGYGSAVLIRALRPLEGLELMHLRRGGSRHLTNGPGRLTQALSVTLAYDGTKLAEGLLTISWGELPEGEIVATTRIGISQGTELPWRYVLSGDRNISVPPGLVMERGLQRVWCLGSMKSSYGTVQPAHLGAHGSCKYSISRPGNSSP